MTDFTFARTKLFREFLDPYGRVTLQPAVLHTHRDGDYDSENQLLWTGEASVLLGMRGLLGDYEKSVFLNGIKTCEVRSGLFSRHPNNKGKYVSLDEYNGMCMYSMMTGNLELPSEIVEYGQDHNWIYINEKPGQDISNLSELIKYFKRIRQPRDRFLYKVAAGFKPTFLETANMYVALLLTARKPRSVTSGKVMAWCKIKALDRAGYDTLIFRGVKSIFMRKLKNTHGEYPITDIFQIYFNINATKKHHPFLDLVRGW